MYLLFINTGLLDTVHGLILVMTLINLPIIIWMLYTYFKEIPVDILEAARMDGAELWKEIVYVLVPMAVPGIASTLLLNVILAWNEAFWTINLTAAKAAPLTAFISSFSSPQGLFWAKLSAASTLAIAPILLLGWFSQKQLVRGLTFGAVKVRTDKMGSISLEHVNKSFGEAQVIPDISPRYQGRRIRRLRRPLGLRQVHPAPPDRRARRHHLRQDHSRRRRHDPGAARQARACHGVPVLCALSAYERARQHRLPAQDGQHGQGRHRPEGARGRRASLNLTNYLDRRPRALSGGQRQRVAIGRAIVRQPKAFLFDEPLSPISMRRLRVNMRLEITELHQQLKTTMIYVTHDQVEAMTMADRIVVLNAGNVEQFGSPLELYKNPANRFVAGFIG